MDKFHFNIRTYNIEFILIKSYNFIFMILRKQTHYTQKYNICILYSWIYSYKKITYNLCYKMIIDFQFEFFFYLILLSYLNLFLLGLLFINIFWFRIQRLKYCISKKKTNKISSKNHKIKNNDQLYIYLNLNVYTCRDYFYYICKHFILVNLLTCSIINLLI